MSLFYIIFTCEYTHGVSAVPPDSPCIQCDSEISLEKNVFVSLTQNNSA
jgi:hypothetical protein